MRKYADDMERENKDLKRRMDVIREALRTSEKGKEKETAAPVQTTPMEIEASTLMPPPARYPAFRSKKRQAGTTSTESSPPPSARRRSSGVPSSIGTEPPQTERTQSPEFIPWGGLGTTVIPPEDREHVEEMARQWKRSEETMKEIAREEAEKKALEEWREQTGWKSGYPAFGPGSQASSSRTPTQPKRTSLQSRIGGRAASDSSFPLGRQGR